MTRDGGGAGDPFDGMTHAEMLTWLQHADHATIQAAADKLVAAAKEIHKIAGDLKTRPQYVAWKGEGAEAFRAWGADLAKSTTHLGDFTAHSGKWLGEAAVAVANAKARMPQVPPDDGKGASHATGGLGPGAKTPEQDRARQEAVQQMRQLGQSYAQASGQLDSAARPVFPPMPGVVAPQPQRVDEARQDVTRPETSHQLGSVGASAVGSAGRQRGEESAIVGTSHRQGDQLTALPKQQVGTDLDSVDTLPKPVQRTQLPDNPAQPPTATGRTEPALPITPPALGSTGKRLPTARGGIPTERPVTGGRVSPKPVVGGTPQQRQNPTAMGRPANPSRGIVGGRPTQQPPTGRPTGMSRGPIVGGTGTQTGKSGTQGMSRPGRVTGTPRTPVQGAGRLKATPPSSGQKPPRATNAVPSRGAPGPRGLPPQTTGGVIGSNRQQPDGSGQLPSGTSARPKGGIAGGVPSNEPPKRMQSPSTQAVPPGASNAPQSGEQRQTTDQQKKSPQPQSGVNTEPQKRERP